MLRTLAPYALFVICAALATGLTVGWPGLAAAQVRISSLPTAGALTGAELLPAVQNGVNVVVTPAQIRTFAGSGSGTTPAPGAFTTLSASGALTTNVTGARQCLRANAAGVVGGTGADCWTPMADYAGKPANPAATTSTTLVMAGLAGAITPTTTGRLLITMSGDAYTATAAAQINMVMYYGTGSAPANGAAISGAALNTPIRHRASGTTIPVAFSMTYAVTGLTPGTAYWLDIAFDTAVAADAASLENVTITAVEF